MTFNDLKLTELFLDAQKELRAVNDESRSGSLEGVRQAWENLQTIAMNAGYRCNEIRYAKVRLPDGYGVPKTTETA